MKKVLVTGACGFIGTHYLNRMRPARDRQLIALARPTGCESARSSGTLYLPVSEWVSVIAEHKPDFIIHCAGSSSVPASILDPLGDFQAGPVLLVTLLEAIRKSSPESALVLLSSAAVYGEPSRLPIKESSSRNPISPYGYHKLQSELACEAYARVFGVKTASARVFSAYGEGLQRQVVWDIIQKVRLREADQLFGTGAETRDFVHAEDIAHALDVICRHAPLCGEHYNVASGHEVSIKQLAETIRSLLPGAKANIGFDGMRTRGMPVKWCADISKLKALGYRQGVSLEHGLSRLVQSVAKGKLEDAGP